MEYTTNLGTTGLQVSRICLGMTSYGSSTWRDWVLDLDAARPLVRSAVDAGVVFFDTADMYSDGASEEVTGTLLRELFGRRDDYVLATKVYNPMGPGPNDRGLARKHVLSSIDASLRRLRTDHVDLYQIYLPLLLAVDQVVVVLHRDEAHPPVPIRRHPLCLDEDAVAAVDVGLSEEEIAALEAPYVPHPILGHQ